MIDEGPRLDEFSVEPHGLNVDARALNEGFADYFSGAYTNNPLLCEYAGGGSSFRQLTDPMGEFMQCRDVPLQGEMHDDSMPLARGLWDVRTALGADKADPAIHATLQALPPDASFSDVATSLVAMVQQKHGAADAATAKAKMDARNLTECPRLFPMKNGDQRTGYVWGQQYLGNIQVPHTLQYAVDVPAEATRLSFSLQGYGASGGTVSLIPLVRRSEPVLVSASGYTLDFEADITGQANRNLVLTLDSADKKLVPGQTHYLLVTNDGNDDMLFDLTVSISTAPIVQTDAGMPDAPPPKLDGPRGDGQTGDGATGDGGEEPITPKRGCSCRAGSSVAASPVLLFAALALAAILFRRRR